MLFRFASSLHCTPTRRWWLRCMGALWLFCTTSFAAAELDAEQLALAQIYDADLETVEEMLRQTSLSGQLPLTIVWAHKALRTHNLDSVHQRYLELSRQTSPSGQWQIAADVTEAAIAFRLGQTVRATQVCLQAADNIEAVQFPLLRHFVYSCAGLVMARSGDMQLAADYVQLGRREADLSGSRIAIAVGMANEALVFHYAGLYDQAVERYRLLVAQSQQLPQALWRIIEFNLGLSYLEAGDAEAALTLFENGTSWTQSTQDRQRGLIANTQRARALIALDRTADAYQVLAPWLDGDDTAYDPDSYINALLAFATIHFSQDQPALALQVAERGLAIAEQHQNLLRPPQLRLVKGQALQGLARLDEARAVLRDLVSDAQVDQGPVLIPAMSSYAEVLAELGQSDEAYAIANEALQLRAVANRERLNRQVALLGSMHQLAQTRQQLNLVRAQALTQATQSNRNFIVTIGLFALVIAALLVLFLARERHAQQRELIIQREAANQLEDLVTARTAELEQRMEEIMRQREEMLHLEKRLAETEKLRAMGQLTGGLAHDFNNLLMVVVGAADLLASVPEISDEQRQELARSILQAGEAGADVTRSLLTYARQQVLQPVDMDLAAQLESSRYLFERALGNHFQLDLETTSVWVKADRSMLTTAILNLLLNAKDATEAANGRIVVRCHADAEQSQAVIEVQDFGRGMTQKQVTRALEPFYSTKVESRSTGLGLSMVDGYVHQSGGDLNIISTPGQGTIVRIQLPQIDAPNIEQATASPQYAVS